MSHELSSKNSPSSEWTQLEVSRHGTLRMGLENYLPLCSTKRAVEGMTGGHGVEGKGGSSKIEFKFFPGSKIHENFTEAI